MNRIQNPASAAFAAGDDEGAMRFFVDGFATPGRFDALPPEARLGVMQNAGFFKMMARSQDPYPDIPRASLRRLSMPVLVITGEKTIAIHRRIDEELSRLILRAPDRPRFRRPGMDRRARTRGHSPRWWTTF